MVERETSAERNIFFLFSAKKNGAGSESSMARVKFKSHLNYATFHDGYGLELDSRTG